METLEEIAGAERGDAEAAVAIADLALIELTKLKPGVTIGTSTLLQRMGAKFHQIQPLSRWMYAARFDGLLDGFWTLNEKRRVYGKPSVDWHNRTA